MGVSLPTFMNGGELKFLGGIKKHFRYFTIFNLITGINTNIIKYLYFEKKNYISNYPVFSSQ